VPRSSTTRATRNRADLRARPSASSGARTALSEHRTLAGRYWITNASGNTVASLNGSLIVL
jgi:hypothetical protein